MNRFMLMLACLFLHQATLAKAPEFSVDEQGVHIENVGPDNPMIYDNDWWMDVFDAYYIWAKASRGEADLRGNIVSRDMWDHPDYLYPMQRCIDEGQKALDLARESGLKTIPELTPGADRVLTVPESRRIEDTEAHPTEGSRLIIEEAQRASPEKPLLVFCGGPLTTVANALLEAPETGDSMIVFSLSTHAFAYNGKDGWSAYIVAKRTSLVEWAVGGFWDRYSVLRPEHMEALPDNPLTREMQRFIKTDLGAANQMGDGAAIVWVYDPSCWQGAETLQATYDGKAVRFEPGAEADVLTIPKSKTNLDAMRAEFLRVMKQEETYR